MISINKNSIKKVIVTLKEKQTFDSSYFVFEFEHNLTKAKKIFTASDVSLTKYRFNEFHITDNITEDPFNGIMNFKIGYGTYKIYEMPDVSPITLNIANAIKIVEEGKYYINDNSNDDVYFKIQRTNNIAFRA